MKTSINEILANPSLVSEDSCNFFYDWFCSSKSLERRALAFLPKLRFLVNEGILDGDKNYVWFKNNCPVNGSTYDDMRISNIETGDFLGGFCPRTGHNGVDLKCSVWVLNPEYITKEFKTWSDFKKEVKTNSELKTFLTNVFNPEV